MSLITPIVAGIIALLNLFAALHAKITAETINPNDVVALLKSREFLTYLVALVALVSELFNIRIIDANTQTMIVDAILIVSALMLRDYAKRPDGMVIHVRSDETVYLKEYPRG